MAYEISVLEEDYQNQGLAVYENGSIAIITIIF